MIEVIIYISIAICFCLWEAWVGMNVNWEDADAPPITVAALIWPISIPIILLINFGNYVSAARKRRKQKEKERAYNLYLKEYNLYLKEKEMERSLEEIEMELKEGENYGRKQVNN